MKKRYRWAIILTLIILVLYIFSIGISTQFRANQAQSIYSQSLFNAISSQEMIEEEGDANNRIAVLEVEGIITSKVTANPLSGSTYYDHQALLEQIEAIRKDESVKAILLKINSPGGGAYAATEFYTKFKEMKEEKNIPVYVIQGETAASAGYLYSVLGDKIFAGEETITGSIGAIMSSINYSGLMDDFGVEDQTIKSGEFKDSFSSSRPMTKEEREYLQDYIDASYNRFVNNVVEGRNMPEEKVRSLADGRIFDGVQAVENGLIDQIGYYDDALAALKKDHSLENAQVYSYRNNSSTSVFQGLLPAMNMTRPSTQNNSPQAYYMIGGGLND